MLGEALSMNLPGHALPQGKHYAARGNTTPETFIYDASCDNRICKINLFEGIVSCVAAEKF
jgi:hypothetical protein